MRAYHILLLAGLLWAACQPKPGADLVLLNGKIWLTDTTAFAQAMAIRQNRITCIGTTDEVQAYITSSTQVIDLAGKVVIPGFNDAHIHFLSGSLGLAEVQLSQLRTPTEVAKAIQQFAKENPDKAWITGRGWQYTMFPGGMPNKQFLDTLGIDKPIYLRAYDGHSALANTLALKRAGLNRQTVFEGYGEVLRDAHGIPTGALTEGAQSLVSRHVPKPTDADKQHALRAGMKLAASLGITSIQNASGSPEELALYQQLHKNNELTLRVRCAFSVDEETTAEEINHFAHLRDSLPTNEYLQTNAIKFMLDGVIESHTAGMLEPYSDVHPEIKGTLSMPVNRYRELVDSLDQRKFQLFTHAIGDNAVREALNAYGYAAQHNGACDARHRIEHIEMINPDDLPRFAKEGVLPSMQPIHADPGTIGVWSAAVGKSRLPYAFGWASMLNYGATLVFGSDWPACINIDPLHGIHVAVNRKTPGGLPPEGWIPAQRISLHQALKAYTWGGAYSSHEENSKGKLAVGFLADMVVLSQDIFSIDPSAIHATTVVLTVFDGKVIYEAPGIIPQIR
jgi:hypothetical protein